MVKTQIQIPEPLYAEAKRVAREREMSFAEVVRRGIEYITERYPADPITDWSPPKPRDLGLRPGLSYDDIDQYIDDDRDAYLLEKLGMDPETAVAR